MEGDAQYAFLPAGTTDEIEVAVLPGDERVVAQDEGVWPQTGF